ASALATLRLLEDGLIENAGRVGGYLLGRLRDLQKKHRHIGDVRGLGLMVGLEIVTDRARRTPAPRERHTAIERAFERGLLVLPCGASTIRLSPPLIAREADVDKAVAILDAVFATL